MMGIFKKFICRAILNYFSSIKDHNLIRDMMDNR